MIVLAGTTARAIVLALASSLALDAHGAIAQCGMTLLPNLASDAVTIAIHRKTRRPMTQSLGQKIKDDRERSVLLAYQRCIDEGARRFIIEEVNSSDELEDALHLLLSDAWATADYRIRRVMRSGVFLRFAPFQQPDLQQTIGEWIGNRRHGVVYVDAIRKIREAAI